MKPGHLARSMSHNYTGYCNVFKSAALTNHELQSELKVDTLVLILGPVGDGVLVHVLTEFGPGYMWKHNLSPW